MPDLCLKKLFLNKFNSGTQTMMEKLELFKTKTNLISSFQKYNNNRKLLKIMKKYQNYSQFHRRVELNLLKLVKNKLLSQIKVKKIINKKTFSKYQKPNKLNKFNEYQYFQNQQSNQQINIPKKKNWKNNKLINFKIIYKNLTVYKIASNNLYKIQINNNNKLLNLMKMKTIAQILILLICLQEENKLPLDVEIGKKNQKYQLHTYKNSQKQQIMVESQN
ncbi:hypothetical protein PPERSA_06682 [Pseudocohnilembus persalinus]|uniref:Uncharacterized protein n=1 Tax=Pseudocohnilembus persalinus TaxID=266149 RepID=A0A0V0QT31_PSEPJ|nr:hypothetical protein PPERSA_06682 [Pseudocohnilembus persalinus]|eukprot:KRX05048.1 hypothetical protein PPERSA_06682 [Pseudocohnilembus persalinus]